MIEGGSNRGVMLVEGRLKDVGGAGSCSQGDSHTQALDSARYVFRLLLGAFPKPSEAATASTGNVTATPWGGVAKGLILCDPEPAVSTTATKVVRGYCGHQPSIKHQCLEDLKQSHPVVSLMPPVVSCLGRGRAKLLNDITSCLIISFPTLRRHHGC